MCNAGFPSLRSGLHDLPNADQGKYEEEKRRKYAKGARARRSFIANLGGSSEPAAPLTARQYFPEGGNSNSRQSLFCLIFQASNTLLKKKS